MVFFRGGGSEGRIGIRRAYYHRRRLRGRQLNSTGVFGKCALGRTAPAGRPLNPDREDYWPIRPTCCIHYQARMVPTFGKHHIECRP